MERLPNAGFIKECENSSELNNHTVAFENYLQEGYSLGERPLLLRVIEQDIQLFLENYRGRDEASIEKPTLSHDRVDTYTRLLEEWKEENPREKDVILAMKEARTLVSQTRSRNELDKAFATLSTVAKKVHVKPDHVYSIELASSMDKLTEVLEKQGEQVTDQLKEKLENLWIGTKLHTLLDSNKAEIKELESKPIPGKFFPMESKYPVLNTEPVSQKNGKKGPDKKGKSFPIRVTSVVPEEKSESNVKEAYIRDIQSQYYEISSSKIDQTEKLEKYHQLFDSWSESNPEQRRFLDALEREAKETEKIMKEADAAFGQIVKERIIAGKILGITDSRIDLIEAAITIESTKKLLKQLGMSSTDEVTASLVSLRLGKKLYEEINSIKSELIQSELGGEVLQTAGEVFNTEQNQPVITEPLPDEKKPKQIPLWVAFALS